MMRAGCGLAAIAVAAVALPPAALAQSENRFSADISATAGYSNNPFAVAGDDTGSALVSLDIVPRYQRLTERSTLTVSGDIGLQQYLKRFGRNDSYAASVDYQLRTSERVTAHTRVDLSDGVLGAFNSYQPVTTGIGTVGATTGTATGTSATGTTTPPVLPATAIGDVVPLSDIGLFGFRNRRRLGRVSGDVSLGLSARDTLTVSGYAEAARYTALPDFSNYEGYSGSLAYSRRVSDRLTVGLRGSASAYDYRSSNSNSRVFPIEGTFSGRLSAVWTVDGALGATFVDSGTVGSTRQTSVSGNVNLCRQGQLSTMCVQAARQVSPTGLVGTQYVTSVSANWSKQLSNRDSVSLTGSYSKVGGDDDRNRLVTPGGLPLQTQYAQAVVGYNRQLRERLHFVASANYRKLLDSNSGNFGRTGDYGGQLGLSYRIGDVR